MFKKITLLSALAFSLTNMNAAETYPLENATVANDVQVEEVQVNRFTMYNVNNPVSIKVKNVGNNPISSLTFNWNDGENHVARVTTNIAVGATAIVKHPVGAKYANLVEKTINVTVSKVNDLPDGNPVNNSGNAKINTVSKAAGKKVVFEKGTGTWCGACTVGAHSMDQLIQSYHSEKFIGIAIHNGDVMTVSAYDTAANMPWFPSFRADRAQLTGDKVINPQTLSDLTNVYNTRKVLTVPAGVELTQSGTGNNLSVEVKATFNTNISSANYRLGVILVEDEMSGTTAAWNQANYAAGTGAAEAGPYANLPNPVPAAQMKYGHVAQGLLGGYSGQANSVPTTITNGQVVTYSFNYTIPSGNKREKMYAVGVLIDQSNGIIVNAEEISIKETLSVGELEAIDFSAFPNPVKDLLTVRFDGAKIGKKYSVSVIDMLGRVIQTKAYQNIGGEQRITLPVDQLSKGNYIVSLATNGASYSKLITVK